MKKIALLENALKREKSARKMAESILEKKSLELYAVNEELEKRVLDRTTTIEEIARFPEENTSPVLRVDSSYNILYSNSVGHEYFKDNHLNGPRYETLKNVIKEAILTKKSSKLEFWIDGVCFKVSVVIIPHQSYVNLYLSDITKEKQVLRDLKQSEKRNEALLNAVPDMIFRINKAGIFLDFKEGNSHSLKYSFPSDQIIGASIYDRFNNSKALRLFMKAVDKSIAEKKIVRLEYQLKGDNAVKYTFEARIMSSAQDEVICTIRDISIEKDAQERLERSEKMYRNLIENMRLGLLEVDNEDRIVKVYETFEQIFGYSEKELLGKNAKSILCKEEDVKTLSPIVDERKKGGSSVYETKVLTKNGEERWMLISGTPKYNDFGEIVGSIGIHLDITHRIEIEERLKKAIQMAEISSRAKEQFLANISHEIRTPMNVILGMSKLLSSSSQTKENRTYLNAILDSTDHLLVVINDVLDFTKIDSGNMVLDYQPMDLKKTMNEAISPLGFKAEEKGVILNLTINETCKNGIVCDSVRLKQIVINLISNAIKFTEKGSVNFSIDSEEGEDGKKLLNFKVADTGIGIPKDIQASIFDDFKQADSSINKKYGGTGLGLSICKKLIELMGGEITLESEVGEGAVFRFQLEVETISLEKEKENITLSAQNDFSGLKILVVEDNHFNQLLAKTLLNNLNIEVAQVYNGQQAIEFFETEKSKDIDLVFMDIQMPVMNGVEAMKVLKERGVKTPIIALTANALKGDKEKFLTDGFDEYLSKPFEERQLTDLLFGYSENLERPASPISGAKNNPELLFDLSKLESMTKGNQEFLKKLIQSFIDYTPDTLENMSRCLHEQNYEALKSWIHKLKSSFAQIATPDLTVMLLGLEDQLKIGKRTNDFDSQLDMFLDKALFMIDQMKNHQEKAL